MQKTQTFINYLCICKTSNPKFRSFFQGTIPLGNCTKENIKKLDIQEGEVIFRCTRCECIKTDRAHHCRFVTISSLP